MKAKKTKRHLVYFHALFALNKVMSSCAKHRTLIDHMMFVLIIYGFIFQVAESGGKCYRTAATTRTGDGPCLQVIMTPGKDPVLNPNDCAIVHHDWDPSGIPYASKIRLLCRKCGSNQKLLSHHIQWFDDGNRSLHTGQFFSTEANASRLEQHRYKCKYSKRCSRYMPVAYDCTIGTKEEHVEIKNCSWKNERKLLGFTVLINGQFKTLTFTHLELSTLQSRIALGAAHFNVTSLPLGIGDKGQQYGIVFEPEKLRSLEITSYLNLTISYKKDNLSRIYCSTRKAFPLQLITKFPMSLQDDGKPKFSVTLVIFTLLLIAAVAVIPICLVSYFYIRKLKPDSVKKGSVKLSGYQAVRFSEEATDQPVTNELARPCNSSTNSLAVASIIGYSTQICNPYFNSGGSTRTNDQFSQLIGDSFYGTPLDEPDDDTEEDSNIEAEASNFYTETISNVYGTTKNPNKDHLPPCLDFERFEICEEIGRGRFGKVFRAQYLGRSVAVKQPKGSGDFNLLMAQQLSITELVMLGYLKHRPCKYVIEAEGYIKDPKRGYSHRLVLPYYEHGTLEKYLKNTNPPLSTQIQIALDVAYACLHVIQCSVYHRDIAPRNVLVLIDPGGEYESCILVDFSLAQMCYRKQQTTPISTFMNNREVAPECFEGLFSHQSEVYSYALLVWSIFAHGEIPFKELSQGDLTKRGIRPLNALTPKVPEYCSENIRNLLQDCWTLDSENRPRFERIIAVLEKEREHVETKRAY